MTQTESRRFDTLDLVSAFAMGGVLTLQGIAAVAVDLWWPLLATAAVLCAQRGLTQGLRALEARLVARLEDDDEQTEGGT